MPYRPSIQFEKKPFNRCIDCVHIGVNCSGPNLLTAGVPRVSEWCRLRKDYLRRKDPKWTNEYIANQTGFSYPTISRFMAGDLEDLKVSTATAIVNLLCSGTTCQYPCALASGEIDLSSECAYLRELLSAEQRKVEFLREQIIFKDEQFRALASRMK